MNQNPTLNFDLTLEEANIVLASLQELPAKICNPLSDKIKQQAAPQIEALQKADEEASNKVVAEEVN